MCPIRRLIWSGCAVAEFAAFSVQRSACVFAQWLELQQVVPVSAGTVGALSYLFREPGYLLNAFSVSRIEKSEPGAGAAAAIDLPVGWVALALAAGYVCPLCAQVDLLRGAVVEYEGGALKIGGRVLIGPAGKVFAFGGASAAALWVSVCRARGERELELSGQMEEAARAVWLSRKRPALEASAAVSVNAAARQKSAEIKAALLIEANFGLSKWAHL